MIYLSDDYMEKYINTFGYLLSRSINKKYSFPFIEKSIAYSNAISELEKSNITSIAFASSESIYSQIFNKEENDGFVFNPYSVYGWMGFIYVHLFINLKTTFETLFIVFPIEKLISLYPLYHEMDYTQIVLLTNELVPYSYLDNIMKCRGVSSNELSKIAGIPISTINALRYKKRDINKFEAKQLLKIAHALDVKLESLLSSIDLIFDKVEP